MVCLLFASLVLATRLPYAPGQFFTFDDVNLAYAAGHFDVRISQPQPPGYPLFVLEMRLLYLLHIRRPETILFTLALAGSIAVLCILLRFGRHAFGGLTGFFAAALLVFHPVFWHAGITSALRVQLALVSLLAASACWRAWNGETRWVLWSALALGLCAGIRPEIGPVLFPLWAVSALRAPVSWQYRARALAAMAAAVLVWLIPTMWASGGPIEYSKACLGYLGDQASETSVLFGAIPNQGQETFWRLLAWTCCGMLSWTFPAALAWRRKDGWGIGRDRLAFLALWALPAFVFSLFVHVQDPGHALAMAPPIALFGGYLFDRALNHLHAQVSRWQTPILIAAALAIGWQIEFRNYADVVVRVPLIALAAGLLLRFDALPNAGHLPGTAAMLFLLIPVALVNYDMFQFEGWYYKGASTAGLPAAWEAALGDLNSGLALTSIGHIRNTLAVDDHSLRAAIRLAADRPGATTLIWEHGLVTWRKAAYYVRGVPVVVLEHQTLRAGSKPVIAIWNGPTLTHRAQGPAPLRTTVAAGSRIVWLLNPRTEFYKLVSQSFPLTAAGPVYFTDLPSSSSSQVLGEYEVAW